MLNIFFLIKIFILSIWLIIIRGTLPRYKIDDFMISTWKDWVFLFLSYFLSIFILFSIFYF